MPKDYRQKAVQYYNRFGEPPSGDITFYRSRVTGNTGVLGLGGGPDELKAFWESRDGRKPNWSKPYGEETVTMTDICVRDRDNPLTVFPELIYRRHAPYNA